MAPNASARNDQIECAIDEAIFPRPVSIAAAYRFIDRCYVRLARAGRGKLTVSLKTKRKLAKAALASLAAEFDNELLHQLMRHQVAAQTDGLREVLVGRALLSAEPIASFDAGAECAEGDDADLDYLDDPLGIAVPWEEKYGDEQATRQAGQDRLEGPAEVEADRDRQTGGEEDPGEEDPGEEGQPS